ncbi:MAG: acyl carrier protein [Ktedonobacteraceae bacterium]|nr:acyl carrier protein [Ktedonobacteraceae bacterium]
MQLLQGYLTEQVAGVLRMPSETLDNNQPLTALGLDSLMAIELKNRLEVELAVRIPIVTFLQGPSIVQFTAQLLDQLQAKGKTEETSEQQNQVSSVIDADSLSKQDAAQLLSQLDHLSDQDVDALLNQMQGPPSSGPERMLGRQSIGSLHKGDEEGNEHKAVHSSNGQNGHAEAHLDLSPQDAQALLAQLDQLSDEQVDALLGQMAQKEERQ